MPTFHQIAAKSIRATGETIERVVNATPHDMQIWKPLDNGRTVLDQMMECAAMNIVMAQTFTDHKLPPWNLEIYSKLLEENETNREEAGCIQEKRRRHCRCRRSLFRRTTSTTLLTLPVWRGRGENIRRARNDDPATHLSYHSGPDELHPDALRRQRNALASTPPAFPVLRTALSRQTSAFARGAQQGSPGRAWEGGSKDIFTHDQSRCDN